MCGVTITHYCTVLHLCAAYGLFIFNLTDLTLTVILSKLIFGLLIDLGAK